MKSNNSKNKNKMNKTKETFISRYRSINGYKITLKSSATNPAFESKTIVFEDFSLFTNKDFQKITNIITKEIKYFLKKIDKNYDKKSLKYFVAGLGSHDLSIDKLGYLVSSKVISTSVRLKEKKLNKNYFGDVFSLSPSITNTNGQYTSDILSALIEKFKPNILFVIDSLLCKKIDIIARSFQITDAGLSPGELSKLEQPSIKRKNLKIPVISIGCPLAYKISTQKMTQVLTIKDIDLAVQKLSEIIAYSLNKVLHPHLKNSEIVFLMND